MSNKTAENLVKTKTALANKYERLVKTTKSKPRKESLKKQAEKYRRQAEQIARM